MSKNSKEALLKVKDLEIQYIVEGTICNAVNKISFDIDYGETLGLVGETGAGKTTTALSIIGLVPIPPGCIINGKILYKGQDLLKITERQWRKVRGGDITMIFQDPMSSLNPVMTIGQQIMEVIQLHEEISKIAATKKAKSMLELVGIPGSRYDEYPYQFSGGMKQRVMIAIALACNPLLLIADEPTTALDVTIQAQVLKLIGDLKKEFNTAMLLITHDLGVVAEVCDKVAIMYAGEIVELGLLTDIYNNSKHPYTRGLFNSIPDIDIEEERLRTISGEIPDPLNLPNGCKFHPRCTRNLETCMISNPSLVKVGKDHYVKCHLYK